MSVRRKWRNTVEAYSLDQLRVEGIAVKTIIDLELRNCPGNHAVLEIKAEADETADEELLYHTKSRQAVALYGGGQLLFKGILHEITLEKKNDVRYAVLLVKSFSMLMDTKKKSRTFQDTALTYGELIRQLLGEYPGADCCLSFADRPIGRILVQYQETDWQFLCRIVSALYLPVANAVNADNIRLYVGVPQIEEDCRYSITAIDKKEEVYKRTRELGLPENAFVDYEFYADVCLGVFSSVLLASNRFVVHQVRCRLKRGMLNCRYTARSAAGILSLPFYPLHLVGNALPGRILEVKGNRVRVHFAIDDGNRLATDSYWFPYATLSAAGDGSGWYYMPEVGDQVRIQFPTKHAADALVISSVSGYGKPKSGEDRMQDPSTKYLRHTGGQRLGMSRDGVSVTTRSGAAAVSVGNTGAVMIAAAGDITVSAQESITLKSEKVNIHALEKLSLLCEQGSAVELKEDGNMQLSGAEVLVN